MIYWQASLPRPKIEQELLTYFFLLYSSAKKIFLQILVILRVFQLWPALGWMKHINTFTHKRWGPEFRACQWLLDKIQANWIFHISSNQGPNKHLHLFWEFKMTVYFCHYPRLFRCLSRMLLLLTLGFISEKSL